MSNCSDSCEINSFCDEQSSKCVCEDGFFQILDFVTDEENNEKCFGNTNILVAFNVLAFVVAVLAIISYLAVLEKVSQAKRLIFFFFCTSGGAIVSAIKFVDLQNHIIGKDPVTTIIFGLTCPFLVNSVHVAMVKYVSVQYKMVIISPKGAKERIQRWERILIGNSVIPWIGFIVFVMNLVEESELLMRIAFAIFSFTLFVVSISVAQFSQMLLHDVISNARSKAEMKDVLIQIKGVMYSCCVAVTLSALLFLAGACSTFMLQIWFYFLPWICTLCSLSTILSLYFNARKRVGAMRKKSTSNSRTRKRTSALTNERVSNLVSNL